MQCLPAGQLDVASALSTVLPPRNKHRHAGHPHIEQTMLNPVRVAPWIISLQAVFTTASVASKKSWLECHRLDCMCVHEGRDWQPSSDYNLVSAVLADKS